MYGSLLEMKCENRTMTPLDMFSTHTKMRMSQNTDEGSKQPHRMLVHYREASLNLCLCIIFVIQIVFDLGGLQQILWMIEVT